MESVLSPRKIASGIILALFALLAACYLTGCAQKTAPETRIPVARIVTLPAERAAAQVERSVLETQRTAHAAVRSIESAATSAASLFRAAPLDLRPLVDDLTQKLADARRDADANALQADVAAKAVEELTIEKDKLSASIEASAIREAALADQRDAAREAAHKSALEVLAEKARTAAAQFTIGWLTIALALLALALLAAIFRKPLARLAARFAGLPIP